MKTWYVASTGDHQGLIVDEATGKNIAVAYDKQDAPLLAASPQLANALITCPDLPDDWHPSNPDAFAEFTEAFTQWKRENFTLRWDTVRTLE